MSGLNEAGRQAARRKMWSALHIQQGPASRADSDAMADDIITAYLASTSPGEGGEPAARPKAKIGGGPYPEAWFPWTRNERPNLYDGDEIRIKHANGVYSNRTTSMQVAWDVNDAEWRIVEIGAFLSQTDTLKRLETLTGYTVVASASPDREKIIEALTEWHEARQPFIGHAPKADRAALDRLGNAEDALHKLAAAIRRPSQQEEGE
jgi:hypothetical protein